MRSPRVLGVLLEILERVEQFVLGVVDVLETVLEQLPDSFDRQRLRRQKEKSRLPAKTGGARSRYPAGRSERECSTIRVVFRNRSSVGLGTPS